MTMTQPQTRPQLTINLEISDETIQGVINNAAQGAHYWAHLVAEEDGVYTFVDYVRALYAEEECSCGDCIQEQWEADGGGLVLDTPAIKRGLILMAKSKEGSRHLVNILLGRDDSETADVFLQFCLLGQITYG